MDFAPTVQRVIQCCRATIANVQLVTLGLHASKNLLVLRTNLARMGELAIKSVISNTLAPAPLVGAGMIVMFRCSRYQILRHLA